MSYSIIQELVHDAAWVVFVIIGLMIPLCGLIDIVHGMYRVLKGAWRRLIGEGK